LLADGSRLAKRLEVTKLEDSVQTFRSEADARKYLDASR
jgi:hypothetical protein